ncbi:MAG TPA: prepilin-type N-terminal cleavage/methylation domain-containing protein [bacterium]|nr:prepilin-type N-terminal cleavage/methylation domain-containing protein [bacterium]
MSQRAQGFSLLEVLVALSIMALSLGVLYQTQIGATRNLTQSLALQRATLYAQSILANATGLAADHETQEGQFEDGYRWQLTITPIDILPPPPAEKPVIPMLQLDLDIFWQDGNKERQLHLQSLSRPHETK